MNTPEKDDLGQLKLRIPRELKAELQERAEENRRTLNNECVFRLEQTLQQSNQPQGATA